MEGKGQFNTYTFEEKYDKKTSQQKNGSFNSNIINTNEEALISINEESKAPNYKESFKYSAAKQNEWIRDLFQSNKTEKEVDKEIELFVLKTNGYQYNKETRGYTNISGKLFGPESPDILRVIGNNEVMGLKKGVESALDFAKFIYKDNKDGDRLWTNDTLDAGNKIDFIQNISDENGNINEINFIQVKSKKPLTEKELSEAIKQRDRPKETLSTETVEVIQKAHKKYFENINKIAEKEIIEKILLDHKENMLFIQEKYGEKILDIIYYLLDVENKQKEEVGKSVIDNIIKDNNLNLTKNDWYYLSVKLNDPDIYNEKIEEICGDDVDIEDLKLLKQWLDNKSNKEDKELMNSVYREYSPNNIIVGKKFNSVIYYKEYGVWVKEVIPLD